MAGDFPLHFVLTTAAERTSLVSARRMSFPAPPVAVLCPPATSVVSAREDRVDISRIALFFIVVVGICSIVRMSERTLCDENVKLAYMFVVSVVDHRGDRKIATFLRATLYSSSRRCATLKVKASDHRE